MRALPIMQGNPTAWSNLYSAIVIASKLNPNVSNHQKTIVPFD